jgi:ribosomal protein L12E/L44/L45/RPP1/RPP2
MNNQSIRSDFVLLKCASKFSRDSIDKVFEVIIRKVVHARFAVVFRQWKEVNCKKHEVATRAQLKATVPGGKKGEKRHAAALNCEEDMTENTENKKAKVNQC